MGITLGRGLRLLAVRGMMLYGGFCGGYTYG